ncbi:MAG: RNA methyltransferase [Pseudomonadota bacterium]
MTSKIDEITSASNPIVKRFRSLDRKKGRAETGLFLAEGIRLITQGLARGWTLETLVVSTASAENAPVAALQARAQTHGARVVHAPGHLMARMARKDNPQSVQGAFRQRAQSLADLAVNAHSARFLALYEVRDPGNLGTLVRTADCAGMNGVLLVETCCDPYSVEAVRASMGSIFDIPVVQTSAQAFLDWTKAHQIQLSAASMNGTVRHDEAHYKSRSAILMGNEQSGLPPAMEQACDQRVRIPMRGGADSLNLAQAAAIMVYEVWRQGDFT